MTKVLVEAFGLLLDASVSKSTRPSNGAFTTITSLVVPKTKQSTEIFTGWRQDTGVYFSSNDGCSGDYFLIDETPTEYHFVTR
ncbi:hypothetical protein GCM10011328_11810 [Hafnia psychrotolerans]|uniref:Uncharacterized protein n=1 Tax=Hafnia psychrotolerans TaxID=1477018 RepID=A0ABQ1G841_9GAMM|nr:hypothetical protein GCM10011328_11810 [Hafnia psychrotolerans]